MERQPCIQGAIRIFPICGIDVLLIAASSPLYGQITILPPGRVIYKFLSLAVTASDDLFSDAVAFLMYIMVDWMRNSIKKGKSCMDKIDTAVELFTFEEIEKLLAECPSWEHVCSQYLTDTETTLGNISIVLPYTYRRESGAPARNAIIPIAEGCSVLPLLETTMGLIPMREEYNLCSYDEMVELLENHEKEAARISYVLRTSLSRIDKERQEGSISQERKILETFNISEALHPFRIQNI